MAILDVELEFSDAQTLVASSAAVTQSTDVIDLTGGNAGKDGWGSTLAERLFNEKAMWHAQVNTTMVGASAVVLLKLMVHSAATSIKSGTEIAQMRFPAVSTAGFKNSVSLPAYKLATTDRYLGVTYTVSGGNVTAGAVDSWIGLGATDTQI